MSVSYFIKVVIKMSPAISILSGFLRLEVVTVILVPAGISTSVSNSIKKQIKPSN